MVDAENGYNSNIAHIVKAGIILVGGGVVTYITKQLKFKETSLIPKTEDAWDRTWDRTHSIFQGEWLNYYAIEASLTSLKKYKELIYSKRNFNNFK